MNNSSNFFSRAIKDGFFLILPLGITIWIINWIWSFLMRFVPNLSIIIPNEWLSHNLYSSIVNLVFLLIVVIVIMFFGLIASTVLGKFFHFLIDKLLMAPTFIRPIYTTFKKVAEVLFQDNTNNSLSKGLSESILVPYPNIYSRSIGFITANHACHIFGKEEGEKWLTVYMPSAPLVSAGFYLICKKEDTSPCLLPSGSAMTAIISVGTSITDEENKITISKKPPTPKKYNIKVWFFNGLLFLAPVVGTIAILSWIFRYLHKILVGLVNLFPPFFSYNIPQIYYEGLIIISLFIIILFIIMVIGFIGESAFGSWFKSITHKLFNIIPTFNTIYTTIKKITKVFSPDPSKNNKFSQAVLVPYPSEKTYAIGFVTGTDSTHIDKDGINSIPVFIPTTPIPTTGWFISINKDQIIPLDIPIEKAFALVISSGILAEDTNENSK